jgi:hypothetical protein
VKGTDKSNRKKVKEIFELGSKERGCVALCSDSMSEGVNLQQGSAIVLLDMPSVVRVIEQRVGRLDRMDSPHIDVEIYWPVDSKEFALKTDIRFFNTLTIVDNVLGSNFDFPDDFFQYKDRVIKTDEAIEEYKKLKEKEQWDGIRDAFQSVRELVWSDSSIIEAKDYDKIKDVKEAIRCRVSLVQSPEAWAFFAIRGSPNHAPQWFFLESPDNLKHTGFEEGRNFYVDLNNICQKLRERLGANTTNLKWSEQTEGILNEFLAALDKNQVKLLPNKKRRALEILKRVLNKYLSEKGASIQRKKYIKQLLTFFEPFTDDSLGVNLYQFAQLWLDIIQPRMIELKKSNRRWRNVIDLESLRRDLERKPLTDEDLKRLVENVMTIDSLDKRIASCIIGYPADV